MKKTKSNQKLTFARDTLRNLTPTDLQAVNGGLRMTFTVSAGCSSFGDDTCGPTIERG